MAYGLKISKANKDVKIVDNKDLIITSELENFKIFMVGTQNVSITPIPGQRTLVEYEITHNLGYFPAFLAFVKQPGSSTYRPCPFDSGGFEAGMLQTAYCTKTKLTLVLDDAEGTSGGGTYTFKYYIFANSIIPQPLPRVSSEGPWLDLVYSDITFGVNISKPSPTPGSILDVVYGDITLGD